MLRAARRGPDSETMSRLAPHLFALSVALAFAPPRESRAQTPEIPEEPPAPPGSNQDEGDEEEEETTPPASPPARETTPPPPARKDPPREKSASASASTRAPEASRSEKRGAGRLAT